MEQNILFHHTPATATILLTCWVEMAQEMPLTISETLFVVGDGVFVTRLNYEKKGLIWWYEGGGKSFIAQGPHRVPHMLGQLML